MIVHHGDCREVMSRLAIGSAQAVVTDPPYGLGFMGRGWDHGVPGKEFWYHVLHVAVPGARLIAFGGPRTSHRLACAIEDAGWEIEDSLCWLYGSGFPKHKSKLKPAHEPIILAVKPSARVPHLNIDACRLHAADVPEGRTRHGGGTRGRDDPEWRFDPAAKNTQPAGRWPANVVIDEDAAALIDAQTGTLTSGANPTRRGSPKTRAVYGAFEGQEECTPARGADSGGASRFYYCAKATRRERDAGLGDEHEARPLNWSSGEQSPGTFQRNDTKSNVRNHHPTVKPIALMRWLCRLITPPGGVILDPFCGSGSTGCAAAMEGFGFIGIDESAEYVEIARSRIAHWSAA